MDTHGVRVVAARGWQWRGVAAHSCESGRKRVNPILSPNTQTALLLTAPLIIGRTGAAESDLLSPGEYRRLARNLRDHQLQPSVLLSTEADELLSQCRHIVEETRLKRL